MWAKRFRGYRDRSLRYVTCTTRLIVATIGGHVVRIVFEIVSLYVTPNIFISQTYGMPKTSVDLFHLPAGSSTYFALFRIAPVADSNVRIIFCTVLMSSVGVTTNVTSYAYAKRLILTETGRSLIQISSLSNVIINGLSISPYMNMLRGQPWPTDQCIRIAG